MGIPVQELKGKEYTESIMRNYHDNLSLFVNKGAAKDFRAHMKQLTGEEVEGDFDKDTGDEEIQSSSSVRRRR